MELKLKNNKFSINGSLLFKLSYLMLGFLNFNSLTANSSFLSWSSYCITGIGALYFIYRLFHFNTYKKTKGLLILCLFLISYLTSSVITIKYGIASNIKAIIWIGINFFLLYAYDCKKTVDEIKKESIIIGWFIIGYTFLQSLFSVICFTILYHDYKVTNGVATITGFLWNRLWGFYSDPNYGAVLSVVSILISIFYIIKYKKPLISIALIFNVILGLFFVAFSDSRTAQVSVIVSSIWITIVFIGKIKFIKNLKPILKSVVISCVALIFAISTVLGTRGFIAIGNMYLSSVQNPNSEIFYWFDTEKRENYYLTHQNANNSNNTEIADSDINNADSDINNADSDINIVISRPQEDIGDEGNDISNRRFKIWKSAIEVFKTKPLTGVSFRNILPYTLEHLPETYIVNNNQTNFASMHNLFIDILISQGFLGISLFIIFMVLILINVFKPLFRLKDKNYLFYTSILTIIVPIFVSCLFYSEILYINTAGSIIFWIALGYLMNLSDKLYEE